MHDLSGQNLARAILVCLALAWGTVSFAAAPPQTLVWWEGTVDETGPPEGKLLSDNPGWWGERVYTGVTYTYEQEPTNPPDSLGADRERFGRRLLDGRPSGDWHVPVGINHAPLAVVFDFQQPCRFTEVNLCTRSRQVGATVQVSDSPDGPWVTVYEQGVEDAPDQALHRLRLAPGAEGRYLRLEVQAQSHITWVEEVLIWGEAPESVKYPEGFTPVYVPSRRLASIPGAKETYFLTSDLRRWREEIGAHAQQPAVWSALLEDWYQPILPAPEAIEAPVRLTMARNETESVYLALTNTSGTGSVELLLEDLRLRPVDRPSQGEAITAELLIGGALSANTQHDVRVLPFFEPGNLLPRNLMHKYLTNGSEIADYPRITLPRGGSALLMLRVVTDHCAPGRYVGELRYQGGPGKPVMVDVVDLTLPDLDLWITSWGNSTGQFPFETQTRRHNEVLTNLALGVTTYWGSLPTPGSKAEIARQYAPRLQFHQFGIPSSYVHRGYGNQLQPEDLTSEDEQAIRDHVEALVARAGELGLDYDDWFVELWDEPQPSNAPLYAELARMIKSVDPRVRIYMNPLFWSDDGWYPDELFLEKLEPFYNDLIDISVPFLDVVGDNLLSQRLWTQPRDVNAGFVHPPGRGGRGMAWKAFRYGLNGWAYYVYYAPAGDPWDQPRSTQDYRASYGYQMVFPGPEGAIITPLYEQMREGPEDYRLLAALRERGEQDLVEGLLADYEAGVPIAELRLRALRAGQ